MNNKIVFNKIKITKAIMPASKNYELKVMCFSNPYSLPLGKFSEKADKFEMLFHNNRRKQDRASQSNITLINNDDRGMRQ